MCTMGVSRVELVVVRFPRGWLRLLADGLQYLLRRPVNPWGVTVNSQVVEEGQMK